MASLQRAACPLQSIISGICVHLSSLCIYAQKLELEKMLLPLTMLTIAILLDASPAMASNMYLAEAVRYSSCTVQYTLLS